MAAPRQHAPGAERPEPARRRRYNFERQETPTSRAGAISSGWEADGRDTFFNMGALRLPRPARDHGRPCQGASSRELHLGTTRHAGTEGVPVQSSTRPASGPARTGAFPAASDAEYQKILRRNSADPRAVQPRSNPTGDAVVTFNLAVSPQHRAATTVSSRIGVGLRRARFVPGPPHVDQEPPSRGATSVHENNEARGSTDSRIDFRQNTANPIDTNFALERPARRVQPVQRGQQLRLHEEPRAGGGVVLQDTWRLNPG